MNCAVFLKKARSKTHPFPFCSFFEHQFFLFLLTFSALRHDNQIKQHEEGGDSVQTYIPHTHKQTEHEFGSPLLLYASRLTEDDQIHPRSIHAHKDIVEFVYILRGSGEYEISAQSYPVEAGNLVVYNNNVVHFESAKNQRLPILCCAATGIQIPGLPPNCLFPEDIPPVFNLGEKKHIFRHLMQEIFDQATAGDPRSTEVCQELFYALLHILLTHIDANCSLQTAAPRGSDHISKKIREYVDTHPATEISAPQIANLFSISESYLARIFNRSFGCSLTTYLIRRRIGEAQTLLLTTELPISEIAHRVGYDNQSYFAKMFLQNVGISPLRYRKMYRSISKSDT